MQNARIKIFWALAVVWVFLFQGFLQHAPAQDAKKVLLVFYSPSCQHCQKARTTYLPKLQERFGGKLIIDYRNIDDIENYKLLLSFKEKYNYKDDGMLPVLYLDGEFLLKDKDLENTVARILNQKSETVASAEPKSVDLLEKFKSFTPLAVAMVGLLDGFNPCAFTVVVFFVSFLSLQGYRRRKVFVIGASFILAVFLTYLLLGLGLFNFLYRLQGFWQVTRIINIAIAIGSFIFAGFCFYDFYLLHKTGQAEDMMFRLPDKIKKHIRFLISNKYRQESSVSVFMLSVGAFTTGILVSLLEAVCTGQTYLPTINFVLKSAPLKIQAMGYLILYNLMFVVPLWGVFGLSLIGVQSGQVSAVFRKYIGLVKILMGLMFLGLGIFLIWRL